MRSNSPHPVRAEGDAGLLSQVLGEARSRPAGEDEAQLARVLLDCGDQRPDVRGIGQRRTARPRGVLHPRQPVTSPAVAALVHRAHSHPQGAGDEGRPLPLRGEQDDGGTQPRSTSCPLVDQPLQRVALPHAQPNTSRCGSHHRVLAALGAAR